LERTWKLIGLEDDIMKSLERALFICDVIHKPPWVEEDKAAQTCSNILSILVTGIVTHLGF
jgi:hypothetical protein